MNTRHLAKLTALAVLALAPIVVLAQHSGGSMGGGSTSSGGMPSGGSTGMSSPGVGMGTDSMIERFGSRGTDSMSGMRRAREHELWRANRQQLDFDPHGHLVVRREIVALAPSAQALATAQSAGFAVRRQAVLEGFDVEVVVFETPQDMSIRRALKRLRSLDPEGTYDFNHIYLETGQSDSTVAVPGSVQLSGVAQSAGEGAAARRIGLVDGGVEAAHPALSSATVHSHGCGSSLFPSAHGTEVASRLLEGLREPEDIAVPAELFVADIYCGAPTGGSVDALIAGLAWLVREEVPVINLSVVGPPNLLLQRGIELAVARGHLIVAAVGNDGPAAPPLYPASYPNVVAVTGVDGSDKVLMEAGRRGHVDFAAPGADIVAASVPDGYLRVRGTSYAAPIVSGLLAQRLERPDPRLAQQAVAQLAAQATDLGARGFDPVYGNGCVGCNLPDTK
jgi:hypothetical protein